METKGFVIGEAKCEVEQGDDPSRGVTTWRKSQVDLLKRLIVLGADVNAAATNPMKVCPINSAAAHVDRSKTIELAAPLLEAGANSNDSDETPIQFAQAKGHLELMQILIDQNAQAPGG